MPFCGLYACAHTRTEAPVITIFAEATKHHLPPLNGKKNQKLNSKKNAFQFFINEPVEYMLVGLILLLDAQ